MFKKYSFIAFCSTTMMLAMQKPACLYEGFVVVMDYDRVVCLNDASRPGQLHLPGGILPPDKPVIEVLCNHLEEQTGISVKPEVLDFIAQLQGFNAHQQKDLEHCYYLVENRRLRPSKEDADDLYTIHKSVDELAEGKPYFPRDHSKEPLKVSEALQKIAQHIKDGCPRYVELESLKNKTGNKGYLELFPKKKSQ